MIMVLDSQIFRSYVFGPSGFWTMAPLRYAAKFDHFLSLDCAMAEEGGGILPSGNTECNTVEQKTEEESAAEGVTLIDGNGSAKAASNGVTKVVALCEHEAI